MSATQTALPGAPAGAAQVAVRGVRAYLWRPVEIVRGYRRRDLSPDLIAGVTVAAVAIPQAIAYASIAELPAQYGLYTAMVGAIVGALWGSSRYLATGPTNGVSLLLLPVLLEVAEPGTGAFLIAASTVAVMVGVLKIGLAVLRFGALVTLASRPVLTGFATGAAIHIAVGQLKHLLQIDVPAAPELYLTCHRIIQQVHHTHILSLALGLGTLVVLVLLHRFGPRGVSALGAIVAAAGAVVVFGLEAEGVKLVGAIPRTPPPLTWTSLGSLPDLATVSTLGVGSLAVALLGLVEAVASAQTLARRSGDRLDSNQEFFGQGMASLAAGVLSGYPCSGSFTRSALAHQMGGRSALAGVFTGLTILAGMLVFAPYARFIPRAAIAGVLLAIAWGMVDRRGIRRILSTSRSEAVIMVATFLATVTQRLDFAVLAGVLFSLGFFVVRSALPRVFQVVPDATFRHLVRRPGADVCPQLAIMTIRGPLFFGAVHHIEEELRHNLDDNPGQHYLMLRMHGVDLIDLSGIEMLESTIRTYRAFGGDVFLVRPRQPVLELMRGSGFIADTLGSDHILPQEGAIEHLFANVLDPAVCIYECEHRVFAECQALHKHPYRAQAQAATRAHPPSDRLLNVTDFRALLGRPDTLLIDVREDEEHRRGHLPGARLLPLRSVLDATPDLPRDRTLLLFCRSGRRTQRALHILRDAGIGDAYGLRGGILAWQAAGLPVTGSNPPRPS